MLSKDNRYVGLLYRAFHPQYAYEPLSGVGAEINGGRFNRIGTPALYTALHWTTALLETNQRFNFQPTTIVSYDADLGPVFDAQDADALSRYGMNFSKIASDWDDDMPEIRPVPTQDFAAALIADGFVGMLVRSFAKDVAEDSLNLVLWRWTGVGCSLQVVDDENRLERL